VPNSLNPLFRLSLAVPLCLLALSGCSEQKEKPKEKAPAPVTVAQVTRMSVPVELRAIGNVEPYATVAVKSMVSGTVNAVHFREGQEVARGALLFTIDPRPFAAALQQAEANLARDLAMAANAGEQAKRYAGLIKDGIVTQEQYDQLKANADSLFSSVASDRAAVDSAKLQLGFCYIHAPMSGRTGNLAVNAGNLVKANELPALVTINQITPLYVGFALPEKELAAVKGKLGGRLPVVASVPNSGLAAEKGVLSFLDNGVDPATGTIRVKGTFQNRERRLWPGQFVNVLITMDVRRNAPVVPTRAVQTGQQGEYVYLVKKDSTVELKPITAGVARDGFTVVEKGVNPGDTVVTDGQMRLAPGGKVAVKQANPA
jgi:membrane fusion protein, multidrug efflux system